MLALLPTITTISTTINTHSFSSFPPVWTNPMVLTLWLACHSPVRPNINSYNLLAGQETNTKVFPLKLEAWLEKLLKKKIQFKKKFHAILNKLAF